MKIGFYHDAAGSRHAGGIAVYIQQMAAALAESNDVLLYTQQGEQSPVVAESDVTVIETPSFDGHWSRPLDAVNPLGSQNRIKLLMTRWALRNGVLERAEERLDVLVTCQFLDDLLLSNLVDVPTVYTYHRLSDPGLGAWLRDRFSRTETILANSDDTAEKVAATFGDDVDGVVSPGFDPDRFRPGVEPAIESDDPIVLFVGRLVESKGVYDLLEAVSNLDGRQELHVVGDGAERTGMRRRAQELGIDDAVVLHGEVPHPDLPGYHAGADVFCLPTHDESFGMANVEAMGSGLPVVTTDLEGIGTYLVNGENGLVARVGDAQDLADKLSIVLDSPSLRSRLGEQAREDALEFTWTSQARRLERICHETIGEEVDDGAEQDATLVEVE